MKSFEKEKILNESLLKVLPNFEAIINKCDEKIMLVTNNMDISKFDILMSLLVFIENQIISNDIKFTTEQLVQISLQILSIAHACQKKGDN